MFSHLHAPQPHRCQSPRRGLTLVEMMLVLAVLGIMAAMTWPSLQRALADQKIQEATEMVRTHLARTRNYAIDSVLIYEFRYEPGGNRFLMVPHEPLDVLTEDLNAQGQTPAGDQLVRVAGVLRTGVRFTAVAQETASLGIPEIEQTIPIAEWQLQGLPQAEELQGVSWSEPMLFYPDGSAQQSVLRLEDESGQLMEISVRGLTGAVSAMPIREESSR